MAGFPIEPASRIKTLPPYLFAAIDEMKQKAIAKGVDIINLGIGDPDLPTPAPIVERMREEVGNARHHQYPSYEGMLAFRRAVADWYKWRFGVVLDPDAEVLTLIGSKEGIGHVPLAFVQHPVYGGPDLVAEECVLHVRELGLGVGLLDQVAELRLLTYRCLE